MLAHASLLVLLGLVTGPPTPLRGGACAEGCYREKSSAYQQCRAIAPSRRAERVKCFREADRTLQLCLRSCGR